MELHSDWGPSSKSACVATWGQAWPPPPDAGEVNHAQGLRKKASAVRLCACVFVLQSVCVTLLVDQFRAIKAPTNHVFLSEAIAHFEGSTAPC